MSCCNDKSGADIPSLIGKLSIKGPDVSLDAVLSEQEVWVLRAILTAAGGSNNPLACNENALETIRKLSAKFGENKPKDCGCSHE